MPELPEVESVVRSLLGRIEGRRIAEAHLARPEMLHGHDLPIASLAGKRIASVSRHGKQITIRFEGRLSLLVHLGMTGKLILAEAARERPPHTHLVLALSRPKQEPRKPGQELRFIDPRRFGGLWLIRGCPADAPWHGRRIPPAGVDALELPWETFREAARRRRQIKALLLDQEPICGMGNIYCDESLHRAGIHPARRADTLREPALRRLWEAMRQVLREAVKAGGSSISDYRNANDDPGSFQIQHRAYGREGQPCTTCGRPIRRTTVAGRSTFWCPRCQPPAG